MGVLAVVHHQYTGCCHVVIFCHSVAISVFFSAVNPVIETGGVMGESKINILNRLPKSLIPSTVFIKREHAGLKVVLEKIKANGIEFPIIAKPDVGERGFLVEKILNPEELALYLKQTKVDFIIQEFVTHPDELSVMYHRMPNSKSGKITSVCIKKTLTVEGDGISNVEDLMQDYPRARLQLARFRKNRASILQKIPKRGEIIELEPIGNHSRGTTFLNGNHLIDKTLEAGFDKIGAEMDGIYYGRFDLKCASIEALKTGKDFKILEFNGIASEPAHIYDPKYSTLKAYKDIYDHWKIIYKISKVQRANGIKSMSLKEAYESVINYFKYLRSAKA